MTFNNYISFPVNIAECCGRHVLIRIIYPLRYVDPFNKGVIIIYRRAPGHLYYGNKTG